MESGKEVDPKKLAVMTKNEGGDEDLDLGLKEGNYTSSCFGEKQKEQIYNRMDTYYTYYI